MKNTREMYHFHFQYKTFTLICPSDSTDQTRELGPDPLHQWNSMMASTDRKAGIGAGQLISVQLH